MPTLRRLQDLVAKDATQGPAPSAGRARSPHSSESLSGILRTDALHTATRIAALYAVEAEAYGILELDASARSAAEKGLALVPSERDPVHLELLNALHERRLRQRGHRRRHSDHRGDARRPAVADRRPIPACSSTAGCSSTGSGREDLAIVTLTQAYRASSGSELMSETHNMAADTLSPVMRSMGDYSQALALNQEKIDWDTAHGAAMCFPCRASCAARSSSRWATTTARSPSSRRRAIFSASLGDQQGVAFADQRICEAHIELGQLEAAQRECSNALRIFGEARSIDSLKETQVLQARIFLGFGHADAALATMNEVLDHGGDDVSPRIVGSMYEWRARANAALHNYKEAYADLQEYVTRFTAANNAERIRQAGALRARFETDREIERNFSLKRELENTQEQSNRQAQQLRWNTVVAVAGIWIIALLIYFLLANRSYRMQLVQLASQDPLTGLPNRRRTQELALAALDLAKTTGKPLTLALIDMDHFKDINDRCGHAAGDHVLQEFSRAGREALRETDILGRWGGEEFLLLMPDTPVELAVASLERLRTLVFGIRLPPTGSDLQVSLSAGLASYDATVKSFEDFVARADAALYRAKHDGRDLIRLCEADFMSTGARRALRLTS